MTTFRIVCRNTLTLPLVSSFGYDPYNSTDSVAQARTLRSFPGPLNTVATRDQQSWDFTPGTVCDKLNYYAKHGMHRMPLRTTSRLDFVNSRGE